MWLAGTVALAAVAGYLHVERTRLGGSYGEDPTSSLPQRALDVSWLVLHHPSWPHSPSRGPWSHVGREQSITFPSLVSFSACFSQLWFPQTKHPPGFQPVRQLGFGDSQVVGRWVLPWPQ